MNALFKLQFSYSPLTCMMHSRKVNNKISRLHERCLRVTYDDGLSSFEELLERDNSVSVHNRNIQCLAIELYKVFNDICPDIMKDVFPLTIFRMGIFGAAHGQGGEKSPPSLNLVTCLTFMVLFPLLKAL